MFHLLTLSWLCMCVHIYSIDMPSTHTHTPRWMVRICCATTDSTSRSMRLNSSKHAHAPQDSKPYKKDIKSVNQKKQLKDSKLFWSFWSMHPLMCLSLYSFGPLYSNKSWSVSEQKYGQLHFVFLLKVDNEYSCVNHIKLFKWDKILPLAL